MSLPTDPDDAEVFDLDEGGHLGLAELGATSCLDSDAEEPVLERILAGAQSLTLSKPPEVRSSVA